MGKRFTVAVDFDGVLHRYDTPWIAPHVIPDAPVDGAIPWLYKTIQKFDIVIFTTRGRTLRGRWAVRRWLRKHSGIFWFAVDGNRGLAEVRVTDRKPAALVYLDDRSVRFEGPGTFPSIQDIHEAKPWHKKLN